MADLPCVQGPGSVGVAKMGQPHTIVTLCCTIGLWMPECKQISIMFAYVSPTNMDLCKLVGFRAQGKG